MKQTGGEVNQGGPARFTPPRPTAYERSAARRAASEAELHVSAAALTATNVWLEEYAPEESAPLHAPSLPVDENAHPFGVEPEPEDLAA